MYSAIFNIINHYHVMISACFVIVNSVFTLTSQLCYDFIHIAFTSLPPSKMDDMLTIPTTK